MTVILKFDSPFLNELHNALSENGEEIKLSLRESDICNASRILVPPVNDVKTAIKKLHLHNLYNLLRILEKPVLGIGSGMELMLDFTADASKGCLGFIPAVANSEEAVSPVESPVQTIIKTKPSVLFENVPESFSVNIQYGLRIKRNDDYTTCVFSSDTSVCAALENKRKYGVIFEPELSGEIGKTILKNFLSIN